MEHGFRKRVEASVADALVERIKRAENEQSALEDLDRIRRFADSDPAYNGRLVAALSFLRESEVLSDGVLEGIEKDWETLSSAYPALFRENEPDQAVAWAKPSANEKDGTNSESVRQFAPFSRSLPEELGLLSPEGPTELVEPWILVKPEQSNRLLLNISPIDGKYTADVTTTSVAWRTLPFYQSCALLRVHDDTWPVANLSIYYLTLNGNIFRLNGTSPPIHEVNTKAPVELSEENAIDYLKFFTFFVRGDEGPFYVIESLEDPFVALLREAEQFETIQEKFTRPKLRGMHPNGGFKIEATIYYSNAVFAANFVVQPGGMIEMIDDQPLAGELPHKVILPLA